MKTAIVLFGLFLSSLGAFAQEKAPMLLYLKPVCLNNTVRASTAHGNWILMYANLLSNKSSPADCSMVHYPYRALIEVVEVKSIPQLIHGKNLVRTELKNWTWHLYAYSPTKK